MKSLAYVFVPSDEQWTSFNTDARGGIEYFSVEDSNDSEEIYHFFDGDDSKLPWDDLDSFSDHDDIIRGGSVSIEISVNYPSKKRTTYFSNRPPEISEPHPERFDFNGEYTLFLTFQSNQKHIKFQLSVSKGDLRRPVPHHGNIVEEGIEGVRRIVAKTKKAFGREDIEVVFSNTRRTL